MTVINTYNESNLHNTLKKIYAAEYNGRTEQKCGSYICDIIAEDESIIEIQTSNVSALTKKVCYFIEQNRKIKIVHPVIQHKIIETYSSQGDLLSRRTSPKTETIYTALRSLTGICPYLLNSLVTLEIIAVSVTEKRRKTEEKTQTLNKSRRHLRDWISMGKHLESINSKKIYKTKKDWQGLLPSSLNSEFTPPQLYNALINENWPDFFTKSQIKKSTENYTLLLWILCKMNVIEKTSKKDGRSWIYRAL